MNDFDAECESGFEPEINEPSAAREAAFVASEADAGVRADVFVAARAGLSRSAADKLIENGDVTLNGAKAKKSQPVSPGDSFALTLPEPEPCDAKPENIPLDIVYEDSDVIVVNKPQGMVVHPAPGHASGTLVSALLYHCGDSLSDINGVIRPGIVHRIDKDTSGLIAVAKNNAAHLSLAAQLEDHSLSRVYYAVALGRLPESGVIDAPIARHKTDRKKMAVVKSGGRRAVTHYRSIEYFEDCGFTFCEMRLETGRTHQIRVHLASIGHPILGDEVYGVPSRFSRVHSVLLHGQCLHAGELTFVHPSTGVPVTVRAPIPDNFKEILRIMAGGGRAASRR